MSINFVKFRIIYFIFTGILIVVSLFFLFKFGLKPGIDFTGGSILEIEYQAVRPSNQDLRNSLSEFDLGDYYIQPTGDKGVIFRMKTISEETHQQLLEKLKVSAAGTTTPTQIEEKSFESIGPTIGKELKQKTNIVVILSLLLMAIYIAIAFKKVSRPLNSWYYSLTSFLILSHDVLIPLGVFAVLGRFYGVQITIPIVTALLTVVGYAINNVVVVYDRVRENLLRERQSSFEEVVNRSISQTLSRQINTSLATLLPIFAIFFLGGETLKYFALTLILGITAGTYSSIFLAGPLLVAWLRLKRKTI